MQGCGGAAGTSARIATVAAAARPPHTTAGATAGHTDPTTAAPSTSSPTPVGTTHPDCERQLHDLQVCDMRICRRQIKLLRRRDVCSNAGAITAEIISASLPADELKKLEELDKRRVASKGMLEVGRLKVPTTRDLEAYCLWRHEKRKVQQHAALAALGTHVGDIINLRPQPEVKWAGTVEVCVKGAAPAQLTSAQIHAIGIEAVPVPDGGLIGSDGIVRTSGRPHMSIGVLQGEKIPLYMDPSETLRTVAVHTFNNYVLRYPYVIPEVGILSFRDPTDLNKMVQLTALLGLFKESNQNDIICAQSTVTFHKGPLADQKLTTFILTNKCAWARTKAIEELRYTPQGQMFVRSEAFLVFIQLEPASLPPPAPPPHQLLLLPDGSPPPLPAESPQPPLPADDDDDEHPHLPRPERPVSVVAGITRHHRDPQQQTSHGREWKRQHRRRQSPPRRHEALERGPRRGRRRHHEAVHMDDRNLQRLRDHFIAWMEEAEDRTMYCCDAPRRLIDELKRLPSGGMKVSEFARAYMSDVVLVERDGRGEKHCVRRCKEEDQRLLDGDSDFSDDGAFEYYHD